MGNHGNNVGPLLSNKPVWWMKHGKHTSSRQNSLHLSTVVAIFGSGFFLGAFQVYCAIIDFWGGPIALQYFVHISDNSVSAILQWSSTVKHMETNINT